MASFAIAYFMAFLLYLGVVLYGQQTMTSVIEEKTSRIMEVLASSMRPFQMLLARCSVSGSPVCCKWQSGAGPTIW